VISSPNKADGGAPAADGGAADQQTGLAKLETVLIARYGELRQHLTRRLGSQDWADEALQDTYLRLNKTEAVGDLHNPIAYLFRAALNVALNRNVDGSAECDGARLGYGGGDTRTPGEDGERQHKRGQDQEQGSYDPNSIFRVVGSGELTAEQKQKLTSEERANLGSR